MSKNGNRNGRAVTIPRFGFPALDALMDSAERGAVDQLDFMLAAAVKNDLRLVRNACRSFVRDGLPACRVADCVARFFDAVRDAAETVSALVLERDRKGAGHGKR